MQASPIREWQDKYRTPGAPLPLRKIAQHGRQILEVCSGLAEEWLSALLWPNVAFAFAVLLLLLLLL